MNKIILRRTKNDEAGPHAIMFAVNSEPRYHQMTVGILVPGKAYWQELWDKRTGLEATTLEKVPDNVYSDNPDVTCYNHFWEMLRRGDVIVAATPYYYTVSRVRGSEWPKEDAALFRVFNYYGKELPDGWWGATDWHDDWYTCDRNNLRKYDRLELKKDRERKEELYYEHELVFTVPAGRYVIADPCAMKAPDGKRWYEAPLAGFSEVHLLYELRVFNGMYSLCAFDGDGAYTLAEIGTGERHARTVAVDTASVAIIPADKLKDEYYDKESREYCFCESVHVVLEGPLHARVKGGELHVTDAGGKHYMVYLGRPCDINRRKK